MIEISRLRLRRGCCYSFEFAIFLNIHFFPYTRGCLFVSLFKSKKSAQLCCTFLSGVKCSRNKLYSLHNGIALGSRSLTIFVISVNACCPIAHRNVSFITSFSWSQYCRNTSFELVISDMSISFDLLMYWRFALELSCFSMLRMDNFLVQVRSLALNYVSLDINRLLVE